MICRLPTPPQRGRLPLMLISLGLFSRLNHDTETTSTTPSPTHQRWTNTYPQPPSNLRASSLARTAPSTTAALPPTTKPLPSRSSKRSSSSTRKTMTTTTTTNGALCPSFPCRPGVPLRRHHHHLPRSLLPRLLRRSRQQHQRCSSGPPALSCPRPSIVAPPSSVGAMGSASSAGDPLAPFPPLIFVRWCWRLLDRALEMLPRP
jgi:hypothetical protein